MSQDLETRPGPGAPEREFGHRRPPSLASVLDRAARAERRRAVAWLIAAVVISAGAVILGSPEGALVAALGLGMSAWSVRQIIGIRLARRDFHRAETPPRRAYVVLLHDPNVKAFRPLLAVWPQAPSAGVRPGKPESVWRCDDELRDLESWQGSIEVHEAWLDTGPRSWSKPRWVRADAGLAVVNRRAWLGRWYVSMLLRGDRPGAPRRLTIDDPHTVPDTGDELPLEGSLLGSVVGPFVIILGFTLAVLWLV